MNDDARLQQLEQRLAEAEAALRERADIERALRESQERQTYLLHLADALRPLGDPVQIQDAAARILGEHLQADRTYYARIDEARWLGIVARDHVRDNAPSVVGEYSLHDFMPVIENYRAGRPFIAEDVESVESIPPSDLPAYRALSLRAIISFPLIKEGKVVAAMSVLKTTPYRWSEQQISLVQETAERTWAAVERAYSERALHETEARQATLLHELEHRVSNILAVIRSVVRRTVAGATDVAQVGQLLEGRIAALARTRARLQRAIDTGIDLEFLIREELLAQGADDERVTIQGETIVLSAKPAELMRLAIHELVTNATKHGAIAQSGSIRVNWALETQAQDTQWLRLQWLEAGVKVSSNSCPRRGFGTELLEERVPYDLNGFGRIEMRDGGVRAEIAFPFKHSPVEPLQQGRN
jgi:two-component sensor histidine kinase